MAEWLKALVSKTGIPFTGYRGFESPFFRKRGKSTAVFAAVLFFVAALPPPSTFGHFPKDTGVLGATFGHFPKDAGVLGTTFGIFPKDAGVLGTTFGIFPKDAAAAAAEG